MYNLSSKHDLKVVVNPVITSLITLSYIQTDLTLSQFRAESGRSLEDSPGVGVVISASYSKVESSPAQSSKYDI